MNMGCWYWCQLLCTAELRYPHSIVPIKLAAKSTEPLVHTDLVWALYASIWQGYINLESDCFLVRLKNHRNQKNKAGQRKVTSFFGISSISFHIGCDLFHCPPWPWTWNKPWNKALPLALAPAHWTLCAGDNGSTASYLCLCELSVLPSFEPSLDHLDVPRAGGLGTSTCGKVQAREI